MGTKSGQEKAWGGRWGRRTAGKARDSALGWWSLCSPLLRTPPPLALGGLLRLAPSRVCPGKERPLQTPTDTSVPLRPGPGRLAPVPSATNFSLPLGKLRDGAQSGSCMLLQKVQDRCTDSLSKTTSPPSTPGCVPPHPNSHTWEKGCREPPSPSFAETALIQLISSLAQGLQSAGSACSQTQARS